MTRQPGCRRRPTVASRKGSWFLPAAALICLLSVTSCVAAPEPAPAPTPRGPHALVVGTFNILTLREGDRALADWHERRPWVTQTIVELGPDIIGLQEVENLRRGSPGPSLQLEHLMKDLADYAFACIGDPHTVPSAQPILYLRERLELLEEGIFALSPTPDVPWSTGFGNRMPRYAAWARLEDRRAERTILVVNVHLDHLNARSRRRSAELLVERLAVLRRPGDVLVVIGDFNTFAGTATLRTVKSAGLAHALPRSPTGSFHFARGITLWPRIDHILISDELVSLEGGLVHRRFDAGTDGRQTGARSGGYPSDHFPAYAVVDCSAVCCAGGR